MWEKKYITLIGFFHLQTRVTSWRNSIYSRRRRRRRVTWQQGRLQLNSITGSRTVRQHLNNTVMEDGERAALRHPHKHTHAQNQCHISLCTRDLGEVSHLKFENGSRCCFASNVSANKVTYVIFSKHQRFSQSRLIPIIWIQQLTETSSSSLIQIGYLIKQKK